MPKEYLNPKGLPNWGQAFTQLVVCQGPATTIYISGQVAVDASKTLIGGNDLGKQAMQAFQNLQTALIAAGATSADVVKLTIYIKEFKPEHATAINVALRTYFNQNDLPASTWMYVMFLTR